MQATGGGVSDNLGEIPALVNFATYPSRALAADLYGTLHGDEFFGDRQKVLDYYSMSEGPKSQRLSKILGFPGEVITTDVSGISRLLLGEAETKKLAPYGAVAADVLSAGAGGFVPRVLRSGARAAGDVMSHLDETKVGKGIHSFISPTSMSKKETVEIPSPTPAEPQRTIKVPIAKVGEATIRANTGELARAREQVAAGLEAHRKLIAELPDGEAVVTPTGVQATPGSKLDFVDAVETGEVDRLPPDLQETAKMVRTTLDVWRDKIRGLGKGYLENFIQNYFGHIWKDPVKAHQVQSALDAEYASVTSKRSLKGAAKFLRPRTIDRMVEGVARGLEPVTHNPLDLLYLKVAEMQKFYYGNKILDDMKTAGIVKFASNPKKAPPGWVPLEGREFTIFTKAAEAESEAEIKANRMSVKQGVGGGATAHGIGPQRVGRYYAPEPAARLLDRYLSKGLRGQGLYDAIRHFGNGLVQFQLAWPGYHATFVTEDAMTSELARALDRASHGELGRAAASLARTPVAIIPTWAKGHKVSRAYRFPDRAPEGVHQLADAVARAGGRIKMDEFYRAGTGSRTFLDSIKSGTFVKDAMGEFKDHPYTALPRLIFKTLDLVASPAMDFIVPNAKLGVFSNLAGDWIRRNPGVSGIEYDMAMQKIWDSVDDRMGQMVYDNLFWHKATKDFAFLMVRSVGWNLGTVRALGGGTVDSAQTLYDIMMGRTPDISYRMAYAAALPVLVGMQGAVITYLTTGKPPQSFMDYFYPPTGGITDQGDPERISLPSYVKDVVALSSEGWQRAAVNKANPAIAAFWENPWFGSNRDYFDALIVDPDKEGADYYTDWARYFGGFAEPFSLQNYLKMQKSEGSKIPPWATLFGVTPAPGYVTNPERQQDIQEYLDAKARRARAKEDERNQ